MISRSLQIHYSSPMAYYTQLPALSEVVPADILHDRRFSQFAPYSAQGPACQVCSLAFPQSFKNSPIFQVKTEQYDPQLKGYDAPSPAWSGYDMPSPGSVYSHGSRTPSLSPSPPPVHSRLPGQSIQFQQRAYPAPVQGAVWISSTSGGSSSGTPLMTAAPVPQHFAQQQGQSLVWMPTNMNLPAPCEPHPNRRSASSTPTQQLVTGADGKQNYRLVPSDPANADAIVHIAPGGSPKLLTGSAARAQLPKLHALPESQRGKIAFYKVVKNT